MCMVWGPAGTCLFPKNGDCDRLRRKIRIAGLALRTCFQGEGRARDFGTNIVVSPRRNTRFGTVCLDAHIKTHSPHFGIRTGIS